MFAAKTSATTTLLFAALALAFLLLAAGCRPDPSPQPVSQSVGMGKTLKSGMGYSIANILDGTDHYRRG